MEKSKVQISMKESRSTSNYISNGPEDKPEAVDGLADKAKGHIHDFFGCSPNLEQNKNPYSNESDYFNPNSSSKDLMVGLN